MREYEIAKAALNNANDERAKQKAALAYVTALLRAPWAFVVLDENDGPVTAHIVAAAIDRLTLPCSVHEFRGCGMGC